MQNLGFSTGCFVKSGLTQRETLKLIASYGCKTVELSFLRVNELLNRPMPGPKDLDPFDYISIHAPKYDYGKNETTKKILATIRKFWQTIRLPGLVIFRPDTVLDFSVFDEGIELPIAFENMDVRAESFRLVPQHQELASEFPGASMVLDVQHAYTNDPTGKLTAEFYRFLENRILQIHLSGYNNGHAPLFRTKQQEIIRTIQNPTIPIIIESPLAPDELAQERDYVLKILAE